MANEREITQWYGAQSENDRHAMLQGISHCVEYGLTRAFCLLPEVGKDAVRKAHEHFFQPLIACDECGRTPATYTFHGTESSNDEFGRFEWNQTYHFCSECFAELKPDFKRRYDADMAENV